ncbi:Vitamin B12 import ATP-binding protein BtuD [Austwickia sp. TVS 96-490-7B]|nr:Vitamin B12 import ATP-binding protein BtuD [Austwickia sp. TVS 96-490-7B]
MQLSAVTMHYPSYGRPPVDSARPAVDAVDLDIPENSLVAIVGPSGSGKTSLLRLVAGLECPQEGRILVDGVDVTEVAAAERPSAMVFQGDTLFPDLTVRGNVDYGLSLRDVPVEVRRERVDVAMLQMGLTGIEEAFPAEISGGQARRVALARAWVLRPSVLLLDEPLQGLEGPLRRQLLELVARTRQRLGGTVLHVTHDLGEALSTSDLLVVLRDGAVRQVGAPRDIYERPADSGVAEFVGRCTVVPVEVSGSVAQPWRGSCGVGGARRTATVRIFGRTHQVPAHPDTPAGAHRGELLVRPHVLSITPLPPRRPRPEIRDDVAIVQQVRYFGDHLDCLVETEWGSVLVSSPADGPCLRVDDYVQIALTGTSWLLPLPLRSR